MSFISSSSTLNIGNSTSTTVNISSANTLNLGKDGGAVNIRGLDLLFSSTTSDFASNAACPVTNGTTFPTNSSSNTNSFYLLPYDSTHNLCIQWGYNVPALATITFDLSFTSIPYVYSTTYDNGSSDGSLTINSINTTNCSIDPNNNQSSKSSFNWFAIGLTNKS